MKNRWRLTGSCVLVLAALAVSVQGFAAIGAPNAKAADTLADFRGNADVQVASCGNQTGSVPAIPPGNSLMEDRSQDEAPSDDGQSPDVQSDDPRTDIPGQDGMNREEPYQVVPPDGDNQDEVPPQEDQPSR